MAHPRRRGPPRGGGGRFGRRGGGPPDGGGFGRRGGGPPSDNSTADPPTGRPGRPFFPPWFRGPRPLPGDRPPRPTGTPRSREDHTWDPEDHTGEPCFGPRCRGGHRKPKWPRRRPFPRTGETTTPPAGGGGLINEQGDVGA